MGIKDFYSNKFREFSCNRKKNVYLQFKNKIMEKADNKNIIRRLLVILRDIARVSDDLDLQGATANITRNISFKGPNVYILVAAIVIASVGLNVNSIPVIIGAMLISPLMGPIIGIGYGMGVNDMTLLRKAAKNLLIMVIFSLTASFLYFLLTPLSMENPSELLARTNPTIFDVLIALFGGFAGIIEISRKEKGSVFSGVAIATALMPPLCTCGYALATGQWNYFIGAIYLFFINSVFIALATFLTVKHLHFPEASFSDPLRQRKVHRTISVLTVILIIPSIYSAIIVTKENRISLRVNEFIKENKTLSRSYIYDYDIDFHKKPAQIRISIAGDALSDMEKEVLFQSIEKHGLMRSQLLIQQNVADIKNETGEKALFQSIFERNDQEIRRREELIAKMEKELKQYREQELPYEQVIREILAQYPNIESFSLTRGAEVDPATFQPEETIILLVHWKNPLPAEDCKKIEDWLKVRLSFSNLHLVQY